MTDIVTRLRGFDHDYHVPPSLLREAATEIERLRAEAEEARRIALELYVTTTGPAMRRVHA